MLLNFMYCMLICPLVGNSECRVSPLLHLKQAAESLEVITDYSLDYFQWHKEHKKQDENKNKMTGSPL